MDLREIGDFSNMFCQIRKSLLHDDVGEGVMVVNKPRRVLLGII